MAVHDKMAYQYNRRPGALVHLRQRQTSVDSSKRKAVYYNIECGMTAVVYVYMEERCDIVCGVSEWQLLLTVMWSLYCVALLVLQGSLLMTTWWQLLPLPAPTYTSEHRHQTLEHSQDHLLDFSTIRYQHKQVSHAHSPVLSTMAYYEFSCIYS